MARNFKTFLIGFFACALGVLGGGSLVFANPSEQGSLQGVATGFTAVDHSPFLTFISTRPKAGGQATRDAHKILKQINFDGTNGTKLADMGIEQAV